MKKYEIVWCEVKKTGEKNGKAWKITTMTLKDEQGVETSNVDTFDEVMNGTTIEGEITEGQYGKNFKKAMNPNGTRKPNMERVMEKKATQIAESQERKERSIHAAQDRSAWMWAKNNATMIIANHTAYKYLAEESILGKVEELATEIYNMEPSKPF